MDSISTDDVDVFNVRRDKAESAKRKTFADFAPSPQLPTELSDVNRRASTPNANFFKQEEKLKLLIRHKKLKLLPLQREFKREILTERYLSDDRLHDEERLMEWTLFDASLPRDPSYQSCRFEESNPRPSDDYLQIQKYGPEVMGWETENIWNGFLPLSVDENEA